MHSQQIGRILSMGSYHCILKKKAYQRSELLLALPKWGFDFCPPRPIEPIFCAYKAKRFPALLTLFPGHKLDFEVRYESFLSNKGPCYIHVDLAKVKACGLWEKNPRMAFTNPRISRQDHSRLFQLSSDFATKKFLNWAYQILWKEDLRGDIA